MWMFANALACGNTFVLKPSEKDPSASLLHGRAAAPGRAARRRASTSCRATRWPSTGILEHPDIAAVSFVGSTPIAQYIYETGTAQRQAGAGARRRQEPHARAARRRPRHGRRRRGRRPATARPASAAWRSASCSPSTRSPTRWSPRSPSASPTIKVGPGNEPDNEMGPLITGEHRDKVRRLRRRRAERGRDGRRRRPRRRARPTASSSTRRLLDNVTPGMALLRRRDLRPGAVGRPRRRLRRGRSS